MVGLRAILGVLAALFLGLGGSAAAATPGHSLTHARLDSVAVRGDTVVSANWGGYVATSTDATTPMTFTSVSARWVQPKARCSQGNQTFSAFWVGLGGASDTSQALEQIGTEANCSRFGTPSYAMWYELVPDPSIRIKLKVFPKNVMTASVTVVGTQVTMQIRNLTRRTKFTKVVQLDAPDVSSAEWVAEAPSSCDGAGRCIVLPLTNFGTVAFTHATATASGHLGTISDPAWAATPVELVLSDDSPFSRFLNGMSSGAVPSDLSPDGTTFSVAWQPA